VTPPSTRNTATSAAFCGFCRNICCNRLRVVGRGWCPMGARRSACGEANICRTNGQEIQAKLPFLHLVRKFCIFQIL
jgi:hypothetical protein